MPRVKRGVMTRKRHSRVLKDAKGYWGARSSQYKQAGGTRLSDRKRPTRKTSPKPAS